MGTERNAAIPIISIVTAVFNRAGLVSQAIASVQGQSYPHVEHIVVDGGSTDGTVDELKRILDRRAVLISEADDGIYDALNKGLRLATGDIVGVVHSDDFLADPNVLSDVALAFADPLIDAVYGDLDYVAKDDTSKVIRHWSSGEFDRRKLEWGWMPPHPTLFLRREALQRLGGFDTSLRIAADYELILRCFSQPDFNAIYLPRVLVKMRVGGASNRSAKQIWRKSREDLSALRRHRIGALGGWGALAWKNLSKVRQFL